MTACEQLQEGLSPYLDAALPPRERAAVDAHLAACAGCRTRLHALRALKHSIARLPSREEPPGAVRAHVDALHLRVAGTRQRRRIVAAALAVAAGAIFVLLLRPLDPGARLADDLVADHLHSVPEVRPAEISTSDPAAIQRFFGDHLPFHPVVPAVPGTTLLGARLCQIDGRRVELLFYRQQNRTLSLFVSDRPVARDDCWAAREHHVCSRSQDGLTLLLVGQLPAGELRRLLAATTS
jgi:anti-sigma factor RsiW